MEGITRKRPSTSVPKKPEQQQKGILSRSKNQLSVRGPFESTAEIMKTSKNEDMFEV
jgi:hypothetical protein